MSKRILVIEGHPDASRERYGNALAEAYTDAARTAGHTVEVVNVTNLRFPLLRGKHKWEARPMPVALHPVQEAVLRAEHLVFFFPLWLGGTPATLKGFLEQLARPDVAFERDKTLLPTKRPWAGLSARVVVTHGHARRGLSLLLQSLQLEDPGAKHPRFRRHRAGPRDARWFRRRKAGAPSEMA
jgi:putative NADPH-quinone reductase